MSAVINRDPVALILDRLEGVRRSGAGWIAKCPAHPDKSPSLSIREGQRGAVLHCHAGCSFASIVDALGLKQSDTFNEPLSGPQRRLRATKAVLKGACSEALIVVIASSPTGPRNDADTSRLKTAVARLRAALSLDGLHGRREIERVAAFASRMLAGETLDELDRDHLTECVEWIGWLIADETKPGVAARLQGVTNA
ncbi:MAG: hypothetical protein M0Z68_08295 [Gammaproteobacteria bacterium]|nr:hypothetical protein [Gammaproteobacteria bacterium]